MDYKSLPIYAFTAQNPSDIHRIRFCLNKPVFFDKDYESSAKCIFEHTFAKHIIFILKKLELFESLDYRQELILNKISKIYDNSNIDQFNNILKLFFDNKISQTNFKNKLKTLPNKPHRYALNCIYCVQNFFEIFHHCYSYTTYSFEPTCKDMINMSNEIFNFGKYFEKFKNSIHLAKGGKNAKPTKAKKKDKIIHVIKKQKISPDDVKNKPIDAYKKVRKSYRDEYPQSLTKKKIKDSTLRKYIDEAFVHEPPKK